MLQPLSEYLEKVMRLKTGWYWLGCYGTVGTEVLWNQKRFQRGLESWYVAHADAKAKGMGKIVTDCTGVFKYPLWVQPDGSVPYQPVPDTDKETTGIFDYAKSKGVKWGTIATIPCERKGILVTYTGHMGCYLGDGTVLEARGGSWGVVITQLDGRGWQYWYENPFVDYAQKGDSMKKGDINENVKQWQLYLNSRGATLDPDGDWGNLTETATVKYMADNQLVYSGYVDIGTLLAVLDMVAKTNAALNIEIETDNKIIAKDAEMIAGLNAIVNSKTEQLRIADEKYSQLLEENARLESDNLKLVADKDFLLGETGRYQNLLRNVDIEIIGSRSESAQRIGNGILGNQFGKI